MATSDTTCSIPPLSIRPAGEADLSEVLRVHRAAFGQDDEADLVRELLLDPTAQPVVSLLAEVDGQVVGHILLTMVQLVDTSTGAGDSRNTAAMLLAPLAVVPHAQRRGVGTELMRAALDVATGLGVGLVFVLGHPVYYPRVGFRPAGRLNLHAPYPIPPEHAGAWMVVETSPGLLGSVTGTLVPAVSLRHAELWSESPPFGADDLTPRISSRSAPPRTPPVATTAMPFVTGPGAGPPSRYGRCGNGVYAPRTASRLLKSD
jgi:putative acetyltransferase